MKERNMFYSDKWKTWIAIIDFSTCPICRTHDGKIYAMIDEVEPEPPVHTNCRCIINKLRAISAGNSTDKGRRGADWYLKYYHKLPDYYISAAEAYSMGWIPALGNLSRVAKGKMLFGGIYNNIEGKLPQKYDRIWYEADINYESGWRNAERIVFSSDGLMFVTYDHYKSFIEIQ